MKPKVTLFDLDHTLLPIDSDYSWGEFTQQIGWTDRAEFKRRNDEFYAHYVAGTLDVHDYVRFAVELERDASGWITGEIAGVPSMREGKVVRVTDWLRARGLDWLDVETTFYSDSMNDLPLLERVEHPVATNPDARLRTLALERGWRILDLFPRQ